VLLRGRLQGGPTMAITGNKFLILDGVVQVINDREMHPRTAIGIDRDTGEVLMLLIDGRQSFSRGYTMVELAELMQDLGADEALNLDGGGSSTMVARGPSGGMGVVNSPSDGAERMVANAIEVTYKAP
jgi:exopolysaccharide biosynthesis protein